MPPEFLNKVKALQNQIQWEYDQYKLRLHSEQYIEKGSNEYIQLIIQEVEPKWFQNLWRRASNTVQSKLQALKETREQEALMSQKNSKNHKIWVDVQVEQNRLLQAMVDSEAINNYILQQAIRMLELTLQWALKPMQIYMINGEFEWITEQVHIKAIILEDSQKLMFDVLNSIKYDVILRDALITQKNSRIDWISKELYITADMRSLNNQKWAYQSISHEIMKYRYWMTSSQSECHYTQWVKINSRKSELTLMRISKRIHQIIKVIDRILNSVCIKEEWHKATMCQLQTTQQDN
jgi:hypothetical protein